MGKMVTHYNFQKIINQRLHIGLLAKASGIYCYRLALSHHNKKGTVSYVEGGGFQKRKKKAFRLSILMILSSRYRRRNSI